MRLLPRYHLYLLHPDLYEIVQEISKRVEATDEYKQIPEEWKDDENDEK